MLDKYQSELESHFQRLSTTKGAKKHPVFVLEHGLSKDEIDSISQLLKTELNSVGLLDKHWLLWIVYAAEQGYTYDGEEYWYSFQKHMLGWGLNGSRQSIRNWFRKFHSLYSGARPIGPWAEHFSIIAWPITHAILPKDLQSSLAHTLFKARYYLANFKSEDPVEMGRLIAKYAYHPSSRFYYFLQQEELVGRIVFALLNNNSADDSAILPTTLSRVVNDLESVRSSNEWLRDARKAFIAPSFKTSSLRNGSQTTPEVEGDKHHALERYAFNIRPEFKVHRSAINTWKVIISFPSFLPLIESNSDIAKFLQYTRIRVPTSGETWLPAGWLFMGSRQRFLTRWPEENTSLIETNVIQQQFQDLLNADCHIPSEVNWVFQIHSNGSGSYLRTRILHPGNKYLIISRQPFEDSDIYMSCILECTKVFGVTLDLPSQLSENHEKILTTLSLRYARTIRIEPVGQFPRNWSEDLSGEWLTTEEPCFSIGHDYPVSKYSLTLNNNLSIFVPIEDTDASFFIKLDPLEPGTHRLHVVAVLKNLEELQCRIILNVRQPTSWLPGHHSSVGILVDVSPSEPTVDHLLEEQIDLEVYGPKTYPVECSIDLLNASGHVAHKETLFKTTLPIKIETWRSALHRFINSERDNIPFLIAKSGVLIIENSELGQYRVKLNRILSPLRWVYRNYHHKYHVTLVDDSESDSIKVCFYDFQAPITPKIIEISNAINSFEINPPGGLFTAKSESRNASVVLSAPVISEGLKSLGLPIDIESIQKCTDKNLLLDLYTQWMQSRCAGPLAEIRRNKVATAIKEKLFELLCGKRWVGFEQKMNASPEKSVVWENLEKEVCNQTSFGITIGRRWPSVNSKSVDETIKEFSEIANRFNICNNFVISEAACRIILEPQLFTAWAAEFMEVRLNELSYYPALLRGARLIALNKQRIINSNE